MAMQEAKGGSVFNPKWNTQDIQVGDTIEGFYVDSHKSNFADDTATYYVILSKDDTKMDIKGTSGIESKFQEIPVGSYVKVTYKGKLKTKSGRFMNDFEVMYDPDKKVEE
jgi:hypothetical protein